MALKCKGSHSAAKPRYFGEQAQEMDAAAFPLFPCLSKRCLSFTFLLQQLLTRVLYPGQSIFRFFISMSGFLKLLMT